MIYEFITIFIFLWFLHALADFSLQSDAMAKGKNRKLEQLKKIEWEREPRTNRFRKCWFWWLSAHGLIQGGLIYIFFGNFWIFIIEAISHFIIDFIKCDGYTNPHQDQLLHIILRGIYTWFLL